MASSSLRSRLARGGLIGGVAFGASQALLLQRQPCWWAAASPPAPGPIGARQHLEAVSQPNARSAIVVGAGVAGICTAYQLSRRGFEVLVLDGSSGAAGVGTASAAAAGGMDTIHKFSSAKDWMSMFKQLLPFYSGYRYFYISWLDVLGDLFFWRWLLRFASESMFASETDLEAKRAKFLPVVGWGIQQTIQVIKEVPSVKAATHYSEAGAVEVANQRTGTRWGKQAKSNVASHDEVVAFEPMLSGAEGDGAPANDYFVKPSCRFGECEGFTQSLAKHCQEKLSVRIACETQVQGFEREADRVVGVRTSRGYVPVGDGLLVVCGGAWSGILCDMLGFFCPIYPLKGYTLLVDSKEEPRFQRLVYNPYAYAVPSGPRLRVSSIGGLGGWSVDVDAQIEEGLRAEAAMLLPRIAEKVQASHAVAGLRPQSADELPLIGRVPGFSNVLLNAGPGATGWKAAAGFGAILAAVADDDAPSFAKELPPGTLALLDPSGRLGAAVTGPRILRFGRACLGL